MATHLMESSDLTEIWLVDNTYKADNFDFWAVWILDGGLTGGIIGGSKFKGGISPSQMTVVCRIKLYNVTK